MQSKYISKEGFKTCEGKIESLMGEKVLAWDRLKSKIYVYPIYVKQWK